MREPLLFRTKLGLELILPITGVLGFVAFLILFDTHSYLIFSLILLFLFCILFFMYDTTYQVDQDRLIIRSSFLYKSVIHISEIKKIKETNNPLSSPAASLDRLEIRYGRSGSVLISPREKEAFINSILSINPQIEVIYKKKK